MAQGWTTTDLAGRLHEADGKPAWNDYRYVWALEKGQRAIDLEDLEVLADALEVDIQTFLLALLPTGLTIEPEEARAQVLADYQAFLQREAGRVQQAMAATMSEDEFRRTIAELAELSPRRRQQVRDHIKGLRKLEGEELFKFRTPAVERDMRDVKRSVEPIEPVNRRATKTSKGGSKKR
jgi:hypothetical protein